MKKKILRKLLTSTLITAIGLSISFPVSASSILDSVSKIEEDVNHAQDVSYSLLRGNNLNYGMADITKKSSNTIYISCTTQCHHVCDEVYLEIYLEQKNGTSYSSYKSWEFSANDTDEVARGLTVIVPSGYYYRVRGYHAVSDDGTFEATSTKTSGILVD